MLLEKCNMGYYSIVVCKLIQLQENTLTVVTGKLGGNGHS